jgi:hypothetical protein
MTGHDGSLSTSVTLGLGLLAATMTLITAGSVGLVGFMLGRQIPQQQLEASTLDKSRKHEHEFATAEQERRHRLRIPSGSASENVKLSDKSAIVDKRISSIRPLIPPAILLEEIPRTSKIVQTVRLSSVLHTLEHGLIALCLLCADQPRASGSGQHPASAGRPPRGGGGPLLYPRHGRRYGLR